MKPLRTSVALTLVVAFMLSTTTMASPLTSTIESFTEIPEMVNPVTTDSSGQVTLADDSLMDFVIPSYIDGTLIETIGDYAFAGCELFRTVTIPASITTIGEGAFADCPYLETIIFKGRTDVSDMTLGEGWSGGVQIVFDNSEPEIDYTAYIDAFETALSDAQAITSVTERNLDDAEDALDNLEDAFEAIPEEALSEDMSASYAETYAALEDLIYAAVKAMENADAFENFYDVLSEAQEITFVDETNLEYAKEVLSELEDAYYALPEEIETEEEIIEETPIYDEIEEEPIIDEVVDEISNETPAEQETIALFGSVISDFIDEHVTAPTPVIMDVPQMGEDIPEDSIIEEEPVINEPSDDIVIEEPPVSEEPELTEIETEAESEVIEEPVVTEEIPEIEEEAAPSIDWEAIDRAFEETYETLFLLIEEAEAAIAAAGEEVLPEDLIPEEDIEAEAQPEEEILPEEPAQPSELEVYEPAVEPGVPMEPVFFEEPVYEPYEEESVGLLDSGSESDYFEPEYSYDEVFYEEEDYEEYYFADDFNYRDSSTETRYSDGEAVTLYMDDDGGFMFDPDTLADLWD